MVTNEWREKERKNMGGGEGAFVEIQVPGQKKLANEGVLFPTVVSPPVGAVSLTTLTDSIKTHKPFLESLLHKSGALLFRGFPLTTPSHFNDLVEAFGYDEQSYAGAARRTNVVGRVYTANEASPDSTIPFHHEMNTFPEFPSKLFFFCEVEPTSGGETAIVLSHVVYERMKEKYPEFVDRLEKHGLLYTRFLKEEDNHSSPVGCGWKSLFSTTDKTLAQQRATKLGMKLEWLEDGVKTVSGPLQGVKFDESRKCKIWFNNMAFSHTGLKNQGTEPVKASFGDGEPLPSHILYDCLQIMEEESVAIPWQRGDVLLIDNWAVLHSRRSCIPPRRVLASLVK